MDFCYYYLLHYVLHTLNTIGQYISQKISDQERLVFLHHRHWRSNALTTLTILNRDCTYTDETITINRDEFAGNASTRSHRGRQIRFSCYRTNTQRRSASPTSAAADRKRPRTPVPPLCSYRRREYARQTRGDENAHVEKLGKLACGRREGGEGIRARVPSALVPATPLELIRPFILNGLPNARAISQPFWGWKRHARPTARTSASLLLVHETRMWRRRDESMRSSLVGRLHGASPLPIPVSRYLGARFDLSGSG